MSSYHSDIDVPVTSPRYKGPPSIPRDTTYSSEGLSPPRSGRQHGRDTEKFRPRGIYVIKHTGELGDWRTREEELRARVRGTSVMP
jgi:hypothetical protein